MPPPRQLLLLLITAALSAGEAAAPLSPGMVVSFAPHGAAEPADARVARAIALHVAEGDTPTPFLPPGRFDATFTGVVTMDVWEQVVLSVEGAGAVAVTVNGKPVLSDGGPALGASSEPVRFKTGRNAVEVRYQAPEHGAAELRLLWTSARKPDRKDGIPREPLPSTALAHDPAASPLLAPGEARRLGRWLLGELRCAQCHLPGGPPATAMPELALDAPRLVDAGARLRRDWMAAWIADPHALRPTARMPKLLHGAAAAQDAADLAAAIAGMAPAPPDSPAVDEATTQSGGRLYARLGCMGCHESGSARDVPLGRTAAKWHPAALVAYLLAPNAHFAANPMPDFRLSAEEATAIAAWLRQRGAAPVPAAPAGDATRGAQLLATGGCYNCHVQAGVSPAKALAEVARRADAGCLAEDDAGRGAAPEYALGADERAALRAFLAAGLEPLGRRCPDEAAQRRVASLRCDACHARDGADSAWSRGADARKALLATLTAAPAEPPATMYAELPPPRLTWAGDKLRPEWMAEFIAGSGPRAVRPWLRLRMPAFAHDGALIAEGLAAQHGHPPATPADPPADAAAATVGQSLLFGPSAFICNQCHGVGRDHPPTQVFEHPGPDLAGAAQRLRHDWYLRWMRNPPRIEDVGMPKFSDDEGRSGFGEILGGDAIAQYEAIWQHLRAVPP